MSLLTYLYNLYFPKKDSDNDASTSNSNVLKKYGVYIILLVGLIIMLIGSNIISSSPKVEEVKTKKMLESDYINELERRIESVISQIHGVGKVKVMITLKSSKEIVLAEESKSDQQSIKDDKKSNITSTRENKVVIIDDKPLVVKEIEPKIEGVVIIAQGADNAAVKEKINIAARTLLGVEPYKIAVFKLRNER